MAGPLTGSAAGAPSNLRQRLSRHTGSGPDLPAQQDSNGKPRKFAARITGQLLCRDAEAVVASSALLTQSDLLDSDPCKTAPGYAKSFGGGR